ncbi:hypothetical protein SeMB42_g03671 [Synchytrium endobioticum]|uniref:Glycogen debranching enzyme n=1 Tax=Synchytrium endobioticum TaxID=286115 RepID=A0A507D4Q1_9FUNG|nr:hypothetical protein SeMB42_g03671 [Synchytrium endobioticum]TPX46827.1 hypothetical protein SeLEV6574_g03001 [Synchytrium endobioticum]
MAIIFSLRLSDDGSPEESKKLVRLPPPVGSKPYILRFVVTAGSAAARDGVLCTNYPAEGQPYSRNKFYNAPLKHDNLTDAVAEIAITRSGVFQYHVNYTTPDGQHAVSETTGSYIVEPRLYVPYPIDKKNPNLSPGKTLLIPLDGIVVITVIPKWLPPVSRWPDFFSSFADAGYNMVHFAPVNTRGCSNSPYSIYNQLTISNDLFEGDDILNEGEKEEILAKMIDRAREDFGILCVTDVVWNHTACNSAWLHQHPEAGYNLVNSPHLRPAYELDDALVTFSEDLKVVYDIDPSPNSPGDLTRIMETFREMVLSPLKLWEYYVIDVKSALNEFKNCWRRDGKMLANYLDMDLEKLDLKGRVEILRAEAIETNPEYIRFRRRVEAQYAVAFMKRLVVQGVVPADNDDAVFCGYKAILDAMNVFWYEEYDDDFKCILVQVFHRAKYLRLDENGPKLGPISRLSPLVDTYFTRLPDNEDTQKFPPDALKLANNGWIWNADPMLNFAGPQSKSYLRREVIAWGDCVKLNYGKGPIDNPYLWQHMTEYTKKMAALFAGFRIDNCHSTPIHVAEYFLDVARAVKPDLYVFAELFTGSEGKDRVFVSRLGINSLIRESMNAWDAQEMSRLVHRYGGEPVGSLTFPPEHFPLQMIGHETDSSVFESQKGQEDLVIHVRGSPPHALFMDCTHDNETPHQKRTAEDTLPNAAIVAMATCAIGSTKGYDEIVPELLNVVTETRKYRNAESCEGIIPSKSMLTQLHWKMARDGYNEIYVHQEGDFISIHRVHPVTHDGYLLIARQAYSKHHLRPEIHSPITLRNQAVKLMQSATLRIQGKAGDKAPADGHHQRHLSEGTDFLSPTSPVTFYHHLGDITKRRPDESGKPTLPKSSVASRSPAHPQSPKDRPTHRIRVMTRRQSAILGVITGLPCSLDFSIAETNLVKIETENVGPSPYDMQTRIEINRENFVPGSIVLYRTWVVGSNIDPKVFEDEADDEDETAATEAEQLGILAQLWHLLGLDQRNSAVEYAVKMGREGLGTLDSWFPYDEANGWPPGLWEAVKDLDIEELNVALYRTQEEEADVTNDGTYDIPGFGRLAYCGLQGFVSVLLNAARTNDLGHPLFNNLRAGPWMTDYILNRLLKYAPLYPNLSKFEDWLEERLTLVNQLGPSFMPKYFTIIVCSAYQGLCHRVTSLNVEEVVVPHGLHYSSHSIASSTAAFSRALALTTVQMFGRISSTGLFPKPYPLDPPQKPRKVQHAKVAGAVSRDASLAAGLPHFATGHMRAWGRDTFISLCGLLLCPGHHARARRTLIAFASVLKHGQIPNLLDQGFRPRYNARDATWWWLWGVQEYCRGSKEGLKFLGTEVARRFPPPQRYRKESFLRVGDNIPGDDGDSYVDPSDERCYQHHTTIAQIIQEILERHARGIAYREWNAGRELDRDMRDEGFNVNVETDWNTGFVRGGSKYNCGTWMDKNGSSDKAGNKGIPATPRDGSPVEIVGLCKAALRWISSDVISNVTDPWPWEGVHVPTEQGKPDRLISYAEWDKLIQQNFEREFYVPKTPSEDGNHIIQQDLVNRRGIYKDTVGSSGRYTDYQLRPNYPIAMMVAPELFDLSHARLALKMARDVLVGPIGMKTLDPSDWNYRPNYINSDDSDDFSVAHGYNYHQGPEWVWICGYFLRAYLYFEMKAAGGNYDQECRVIAYIHSCLLRHKQLMADSAKNPYAGLPELTNANGAECWDGCPTQAWSSATMLELCCDLMSIIEKY